MYRFVASFVFSLCLFFSAHGQVFINEYSGANYDSYTDSYGEYEDWVEIYNSGAVSVDLNGWALSDKTSNPLKWIFPSTFNIPSGGVAIIYCSGRDEITATGEAHSNFKITQTKGNEVLILSDASGSFQDSIKVFPNQNSHTRGRETNGSSVWSVFTTGTPNANNIGAMQEYATTPLFSQLGGYYNGAINLTITSPDPNITIYYTVNGDEPNNTSIVYSTPINIPVTTVVKAIAYSSNNNIPSSFIDFHTFFINDTHTIPILSISGDVGVGGLVDLLDGGWGSSGLEPEGTIEWFDENGNLLDKGTGEYNKHGNDSWAYDQRGFDYIMRDQFGYNYALKDKIFMTKNRDKFQRIILKAAANDNFSFEDGAHIRDAYVHHLSQLADLRMDERSVEFCIVYLNGDYWGVYDLREKADDHDFTDYYYDQPSGEVDYLKTWGQTWSELPRVGPPASPVVMANWNTIENYITSNPMNIQANYNYAKGIFNTGSIIDYFLLNAYVVCSDWLNWNTAWWRGLNPNGDKKKWRYVLWDMDATFDHYINYTGVPSTSATADPCDPSSLGDPGGQGHVPIWNALLANEEFHDDYVNRWQDLANGPFSCVQMINLLDSMIAIIDPEMPRQISTWGGGSYADWQNNVTDLRNFILARCDSMNSGFVDCDTAITGIFNVTVEIIGVGEVEMSSGNIINNLNTPFNDERLGGIALPFEVTSGNLIYWEILPAGIYTYDPLQDTLIVELEGDITVKAFFGETRNIVYDIIPNTTISTIDVNSLTINAFPHTETYLIGDTVSITPNIDPLYGFNSWSSDSVILMPSPINEVDSFYATNNDTVKLHLYLKPTIVYDIKPPGTTTTIDINGNTISVFPYSETSFIEDLITVSPNIDPLFGFGSWSSDSNNFINGNSSVNNSFYGAYNDTVILNLTTVKAGIYADPATTTFCSNVIKDVDLIVDFNGTAPYMFTYTINGIIQDSVFTSENPYIIKATEPGTYELHSFRDASNNIGSLTGSVIVAVLNSPVAEFDAYPEIMNILSPASQFDTKKTLIGDVGIMSWEWDFGYKNNLSDFTENPKHSFPEDSIGAYEVKLVVVDSLNCSDTAYKKVFVTDYYWIWIPNSFSPDLDGVNDVFCINYNGIRESTFMFNVYDRSSKLVYSTNNITELTCGDNPDVLTGWDGKDQKTGLDLPTGAYIYTISYQNFEGWKYQDISEIFIIR